jgi:5-methylcytosine-specific restriction endonuclease McrA
LPIGQDRPHFNLYCHKPEEGENMVLMTKDHIVPKSKGGKNHISNMQTMCCHCNSTKGNKSPEEYAKYLKEIKRQQISISA